MLRLSTVSRPQCEGDGRKIWSTHVEPARVDVFRIVAHLALAELLEGTPPPDQLAAHNIEVVTHERIGQHGEPGAGTGP